jgi:outer membrane protein
MKGILKVSVALAIASFALVPAAARAQTRIAFIDSQRIRLEYKDFKDAQEQFNKEVDDWNKQVEQGQKDIQNMEDELSKQSLILSEAKRKEKEQEIEQKKTEWQQMANEIFGPEGKAEKRNAELTKPLLDKINAALEKVALAEGYDLILDTVNGNVAYGRKELDITDRVLEELEGTQ